MDGFSYTDIYSTKGIEYLIVIAFLLLIIPFWILLNRPGLTEKARMGERLLVGNLRIPLSLFFSRNHTWASLTTRGNARIGLDDFLLSLTGPVKISRIVSEGTRVRKGEVLAVISQEGKQLNITSPVTGLVTETKRLPGDVHARVDNRKGDQGWICELKPEKWKKESRDFYRARAAVEWTRKELARFRDFFLESQPAEDPLSGKLVLQEGGELPDNPLCGQPEEVWKDFQKTFLEHIA